MNGFEQYTKKTRRQVFLEEMSQVVPWLLGFLMDRATKLNYRSTTARQDGSTEGVGVATAC
jgi:hypothetical protein